MSEKADGALPEKPKSTELRFDSRGEVLEMRAVSLDFSAGWSVLIAAEGSSLIDPKGVVVPRVKRITVDHDAGRPPSLRVEMFCCEANDHVV